MRLRCLLISCALSFSVLLPVRSFSQLLPLNNPGFESAAGGGIAGWTITPGAQAHVSIAVDQPHAGGGALRFSHDAATSTIAVSQPVRLDVGKPYRLQCWIRTRDARTDSSSRYPTPLAATIGMESFPFERCAPPVGGTSGWRRTGIVFFATQATDRIVLTLGQNGGATGSAWFDDVTLEPVKDITEILPLAAVEWHGPAFKYHDGGWTFVHIEGAPYPRGIQYGALLAKEITSYIEKLANRANPDNPRQGWADTRTLADALMLRGYDPEFLEEMKGIADGASMGSQLFGRPFDLLDVVTLNSVVDLGQLGGALAKTATPLSGRSFDPEEAERTAPERLHKCSSFLANGPATPDGSIVFGQLFMWSGYTGIHWDIICDVVPSAGHRVVFQTFPGGIHSGADFYVNDAGLMVGETTVMQTPFAIDGAPQSSRIRKAAQYGASIDDVVSLLTAHNNGLYTNDWLIGDAKTNETAILLLGTKRWKLWRSGKHDFPGGTEGFYWSVNNAKDPDVRQEYVPDPTNAPWDLIYAPSNRDIAFVEWYRATRGAITPMAGVRALASSPINRPHACDGKLTTSEMARHLMFHAHYGKVTMREKFPEKGGRLIGDFPGAQPHLTLGYTTFSPEYVAAELAKHHRATVQSVPPPVLAAEGGFWTFPKSLLWSNTVAPATDADNWFVSATAAYWSMLNGLPATATAARIQLRDQLREMNTRLLYTRDREGGIIPSQVTRRYDRMGDYVVPRIRGVYLLHQLRRELGNAVFSRLMKTTHERFQTMPLRTKAFRALAEELSGRDLTPLFHQWLDRGDIPAPAIAWTSTTDSAGARVVVTVTQPGEPFVLDGILMMEVAGGVVEKECHIGRAADTLRFTLGAAPRRVSFNAAADFPVESPEFYGWANLFDDFRNVRIVYGTGRTQEFFHTMAVRLQTTLADQFVEYLLPIRKDVEIDSTELRSCDLLVLGGEGENALAGALNQEGGVRSFPGGFACGRDSVYGPDNGFFVARSNPWNPRQGVYWFSANSARQLFGMLRRPAGLPGWARYAGEQVVEKGWNFDFLGGR